jgi:hypothetical protein
MISSSYQSRNEKRATLVSDPETPFITIGDFDKDRRSLDRQWAELCYIRRWLERHRAQGSHFTFFNEPSFAWQQLKNEYDNALVRIAPLKQGDVSDSHIFADVATKVDALRRRYCRLTACFLVFKNETRKDAFRDAQQFGVSITPEAPRANPFRYVVMFFAAIIIAIYLGVSLSAMMWDVLHPNSLRGDPEVATKWMYYALANYGMPIMAVLLLRYLGWRSDPGQPNSYLISYATIFLISLCVASVFLALAKVAAGKVAMTSFVDQLFGNFKWAISPAVVSIYIAYHVDRQIDPLLPNIGSYEHWGLPQRLLSCLLFGALVTLFSALPTLSISISHSPWPVEKLQAVILGTTFIIGLIISLVGEFLLFRSTPTRDNPNGLTA